MKLKSKSVMLSLLIVYLLFVIVSQVLLITNLTEGLYLPKALATSIGAGNISWSLIQIITITFTVDSLDFNLGFVNETCNNCTMDTEGSGNVNSGCCHVNWANPPVDGLLIENQGTTVVSLFISTTANASDWINGTNVTPSFQFKMKAESDEAHASAKGDDTADSCLSAWKPTSFTEATTVDQYICGNATQFDFHPAPNRNEGHLLVKAVIPNDATKGTKSVTFQLTATAP